MPLFKVSSPTRVDLAGGTTDIWPLYCLLTEPARTINLAIDLFAHATFEYTDADEFNLKMRSASVCADLKAPIDRSQLALIKPELQFPAFVLSEAFKAHALPRKHIQVTITSEVPQGSGLGGSSSLCVALARGAARITGEHQEQGWQWSLLTWVRDVEARFLQTATGTQDYLASLFGGLSCFTSRPGRLDRATYSDEAMTELGSRMVVLFSGQIHQSGLSNWEIFRRALEADKTILQGLSGISDLAASLDKELRLSRRDWRSVGQILNSEWRIRRELFRVNTPRLDEIMNFLEQQSVLGAKVCGAASGGSILALVEPERRSDLIAKCQAKGVQILPCQPSTSGAFIRA